MPRKTKQRRIGHMPRASYFHPIPSANLEEIVLKIEEAEALRLKDLLGLDQVECASLMGVSRTTFQRILADAHKKVADAIINGKALVVQGGDYHYE